MSAPIEPNKSIEPNNKEITGQGRVSTTVGFIIIIIIVATIALLVWKYINSGIVENIPSAPAVTTLPKTTAPQAVGNEAIPGTPDQTPVDVTIPATTDPAVSTESTVDFDYEIKKLDDQVAPVNANDFGDSELSDTQVGL